MNVDEKPYIVARIHYGTTLLNEPDLADKVAAVLTRPCFARLTRLRGRRTGRSTKHVRVSADQIALQLTYVANDACSLHSSTTSKRRSIIVVENGVSSEYGNAATRSMAYFVLPLVRVEVAAVVEAICDLAGILGASAGFIALGLGFQRSEELALGSVRWPQGRAQLSPRRFLERLFRVHYKERIATELAGVEWGNFLGPGHLGRLDLNVLRHSGVFARVTQLSPGLAYLQLTPAPLDELFEEIEPKLAAARQAVEPILMPISALFV